MTFDARQIAWASGLFEGEGCFHSKKQRGGRLATASLVSTDEDVVRRFQQVIGVGNVSGPTMRGNKKPYWTWRIGSFEGFQHVVASLWSNLGSRRRQKAKEILAEYLSQPVKQFQGHKVFNTRLTEEQVAKIRERNALGCCQADTAYLFKVSPSLISRIIGNKRHLGGAL